jgi:hypothetical protein
VALDQLGAHRLVAALWWDGEIGAAQSQLSSFPWDLSGAHAFSVLSVCPPCAARFPPLRRPGCRSPWGHCHSRSARAAPRRLAPGFKISGQSSFKMSALLAVGSNGKSPRSGGAGWGAKAVGEPHASSPKGALWRRPALGRPHSMPARAWPALYGLCGLTFVAWPPGLAALISLNSLLGIADPSPIEQGATHEPNS